MDNWQDKTEWKDLWLLTPEQVTLLSGMTDKGRLRFAIQLKFMEVYGEFPSSGKDVSMDVIQYLAQQPSLSGELFSSYEPLDRQGLRHRQTIRKLLGYRPSADSDLRQLFDWLCAEVLPLDPKAHHAREAAFDWFREQRTEPPATAHLERVIRSATYHYEETILSSIYNRLTDNHKSVINKLLPDKKKEIDYDSDNKENIFSIIKKEPGKPSLDNIRFVISQLTALDELGLNADLVWGVPPKFIEIYRQRCAAESVREIRRHPVSIRYPMIIMYCWRRRQQLTDALTEMLMQLIHNLGTRAEKRVDKKQFAAFKKVRGKAKLLFRMAEATADIGNIVDQSFAAHFETLLSCKQPFPDIVSVFSAPFVTSVLATVFGISETRYSQIINISKPIVMFLGNGDVGDEYSRKQVIDSLKLTHDVLLKSIHECSSCHSVIGYLLQENVSIDDISPLLINIVIDGYDPFLSAVNAYLLNKSKNTISGENNQMSSNQIFDEVIRLETPFQYCARIATDDLKPGNYKISKGERVMAFIASANRDPNCFYMPEKIMLRSQKIKNFSFGAGRHICPGGNLARKCTARLIELFGEFEEKIKIVHVEDRWTDSFGFRFLEKLRVEIVTIGDIAQLKSH